MPGGCQTILPGKAFWARFADASIDVALALQDCTGTLPEGSNSRLQLSARALIDPSQCSELATSDDHA